MKGHFAAFSLVVPDYEEALAFYVGLLGFQLIEDIDMGDKRWVTIAPWGAKETKLLLARASNDMQQSAIGNQTGGRVGFFLHTDDFDQTHSELLAKGVAFQEDPRIEPYGKVAVFKDPFGNSWDLLQLAKPFIPA
ncbi:MAG: extradiol dioxygenase [Rhodobacteraceae bacterium]|nr:MAG: extradiol dioxygenase [Paracoccaceae bacterium]